MMLAKPTMARCGLAARVTEVVLTATMLGLALAGWASFLQID
jgi:hypothetical protein